MSLAITQFPATITLDRTAGGRFRAEFSGEFVEAETVAALFDALKERVTPAVVPAEADEDDPGGPDFDADLERVIREDRELLNRLAR